jgi:hypothetical protein
MLCDTGTMAYKKQVVYPRFFDTPTVLPRRPGGGFRILEQTAECSQRRTSCFGVLTTDTGTPDVP